MKHQPIRAVHAARFLAQAIKEGRLSPAREKRCARCGKPADKYIHHDYRKPLDIEPICHKCNKRRVLDALQRGPFYELAKARLSKHNQTQALTAMMHREKVAKLRKKGFTLEAIGHMFGCSRQRIHAIMRRHELDEKKRIALEKHNGSKVKQGD